MPTIHVPPNLPEWAAQLDPETDEIVIAGNEISPHKEIVAQLEDLPVTATYLHPDGDFCHALRIDDFMEPNHHHRRNFALMWALESGAEMIITLDDDNFPASANWVSLVQKMLSTPNTLYPVRTDPDGWADPGKLCIPRTTHRGYPISIRRKTPSWTDRAPRDEQIGVFAGLWTGDPDIDAIERIANDPTILNVAHTIVWDRETWAPFDSQSTAITRELAPLLFMWPYVGRYDDIWASYLARAVMDYRDQHVAYGNPSVRQARNPHNLLKDLNNERLGYEHTENLCDVLREVDFTVCGDSVFSQMAHAVSIIEDRCSFVPRLTKRGLRAWLEDLDERIADL